jgi:glutamyl-tRNA synthetase
MQEVNNINQKIRVRFAPSPTGFLHVGGARTAIFNWLFAKNKGGDFLIRIEDTDSQRSKSELSQQIIRSLDWLQMTSDEPIIYQSDKINRYREVINQLIKDKKAYYCFETPEELELKRKEAEQKKGSYIYDRTALKLDESTIQQYIQQGKSYVIRFFIPEGETVFDDIVHGKTIFKNSEIDDFIILRSDNSPVYQIAVVVDDHDVGITHVIRGDDHLSNTPKQILLYKALGWNIPEFAHLPMILDEGKKKLSKRRNPVACEEYRDKGYFSEAMFNFLTLLGFAPENNIEVLSRDELIKQFTFDRVNKKSSVFDMKKLNWINSEYIKMKDDETIERYICDLLLNKEIVSLEEIDNYKSTGLIKYVIHFLKERVSTINDFIEYGKYFFKNPESFDEKGLGKHWNDETKELLMEYYTILKDSSVDFNAENIESGLRAFAESKGVKAGKIIHVLRLALTGITISPGIFELMVVLGKNKVLHRIKYFLLTTKCT